MLNLGEKEDFALLDPFKLQVAICSNFSFGSLWPICFKYFHCKCLLRVFDVTHQQTKVHLVAKADLIAWISRRGKSTRRSFLILACGNWLQSKCRRGERWG